MVITNAGRGARDGLKHHQQEGDDGSPRTERGQKVTQLVEVARIEGGNARINCLTKRRDDRIEEEVRRERQRGAPADRDC